MKTIVILLSDKRSGSTMFQDALCRHPEIQPVAYSPHTYLETHHWLKASVLLNQPAKRIQGTPVYAGYGSRENARTYLIDCIQKNVADYTVPEDLRELIFGGWEALCQRFAQPVFFEKSPQYLGFPASLDLLYEWTQQTQYRVKFIGLTRNPLSVQYSAWKLFHRAPEQRQYGWMELQQEMLGFEQRVGSENFLHVQYESIIEAPGTAFAKICDFIGVAAAPEVGAQVHGKSLTKWKDDPYFTLRLDETVKQMARQFGYTDEELDNPQKPKPPLYWRLKNRLEAKYRLTRAHLKDRWLKPLLLRLKDHQS